MRSLTSTLGVVGAAAFIASADAGTLNAKFDIPWNPGGNAQFILDGNSRSVPAVRVNGLRQDTPGSGGADGSVPVLFPSFCVEIDVNLPASVGGVFSGATLSYNVFDLAGATTTSGVLFDAQREDRLERLWGTYFNDLQTNSDQLYSGAFQVAVWKIAFEDTAGNLDLFDSGSDMYFNAPNAISSLAQSWLDVINAGGGTSADLVLLKGESQDLITVVPAPSALALLGMAGALGGRRRRK